jgi:hypothetical protein
MYNSGITAAALIALVQAEADISVTIPTDSYYRWINEVEQMLYTEIIREMKSATISSPTTPIALTSLTPAATEAQAIFEDVIKMYADGKEMQKSSLISSITLNGYKSIWYKNGAAIGFLMAGNDTASSISVVYVVRPKIKASADSPAQNIKLPAEFLELMCCRLRAEAYKLANEDNLAAKWLADYNNYVETFKVWVKSHNDGFGEK